MTDTAAVSISAESLYRQADREAAHEGDPVTIHYLLRAAKVMQRIEHLHGVVYATRDFEMVEGSEVWCDLNDALCMEER
jgi:hypothetical protein